jgi:hypothetical protein
MDRLRLLRNGIHHNWLLLCLMNIGRLILDRLWSHSFFLLLFWLLDRPLLLRLALRNIVLH